MVTEYGEKDICEYIRSFSIGQLTNCASLNLID